MRRTLRRFAVAAAISHLNFSASRASFVFMSTIFPPFDPGDEAARRKRFQPVPLRYLFPNLVTLFALCAGLTAVRLAIEGRLDLAAYAVIFAVALDGIDGRLARLLKGTSRFGAELDSLADFVNFGCVPALILYFWQLKELKSFGWIAVLIFAIAMALRLARFNVALDDPNRPDWKKDYFTGMPAPAGALTVLMPVYASLAGMPSWPGLSTAVLLYVLLMAYLTVSQIPTYSGKKSGGRIARENVLPFFAGSVILVAVMVAYPFEALIFISLAYLAAIPFGMLRYRAQERAFAAELKPPA